MFLAGSTEASFQILRKYISNKFHVRIFAIHNINLNILQSINNLKESSS